jgi:hypothetical protein
MGYKVKEEKEADHEFLNIAENDDYSVKGCFDGRTSVFKHGKINKTKKREYKDDFKSDK